MNNDTNTLQLVRITKGGSKTAVVLNGSVILSADITKGDVCSNVSVVANNIAKTLKLDISLIYHELLSEEFCWDNVAKELEGERGTLFTYIKPESF
ncbi:hypothetical protein VCHA53O466_140058 [Vibrio chagasii]|nr:hypothetical protein VCHA53O466_140058 [Vibrio chagasii]